MDSVANVQCSDITTHFFFVLGTLLSLALNFRHRYEVPYPLQAL